MERCEEDDQSDCSTVYVRTTREEYSETVSHSVSPRSVHPDEAASSSAAPAALKLTGPVYKGFKHYGPRVRLHCRTGYSLVILPNGIVTTDQYANNQAGVLEFSSAGIGEVRIRGVQANLYLAMNENGNLYGEENPRDYATVFVEGIYGQYNTYLSQKYAHNGWYVGIKKNGIIKRGPLTQWGQKAIQFLPLRDEIKN
ncbi:fibroblast growth factor 1-like isoform X2 [Planococcus citri]|uniref:fibroblast growth factor 1-like isoform X2 n=1 Tax=Planococcus citri TaxID=170843 RepID=UPI0031F90FCD